MRNLLLTVSIILLSLQTELAADDDILDFLPAILAGVEQAPPPPPPVYPPGVTVLPTSSNLVDYFGDLLIIGEIYNNTSRKLRFVNVTANIFNGSSFVATDYTYTSRDLIPPKTKACFKMYTDYSGPYTKVAFQAPSFSYTSQIGPSLAISNVQRQTDYFGDLEIIGFIKNNSPVTVDYAQVIGSFYSYNGKIIDCDFGFANSSTLTSGQSSSFKLLTDAPAVQVSKFSLQTDGNL